MEQDKAAESAGGGDEDGEAAGLLFGRLAERAPGLREPLRALRARLQAAAAPEEALKVRARCAPRRSATEQCDSWWFTLASGAGNRRTVCMGPGH